MTLSKVPLKRAQKALSSSIKIIKKCLHLVTVAATVVNPRLARTDFEFCANQ